MTYKQQFPEAKKSLYADDTKIWRQMQSKYDYDILQSDINSLYEWSVRNKMRFHPDKCKILSIHHFHKNVFQELPFFLYPYEMNDTTYNLIPLSFPMEITNLTCRTRSSSSIEKGFQIHENTTINKKVFCNSFYVRTIPQWNRLSNEIRDISDTTNFSKALIDFFWSEIKEKIASLSSNLLTSIREPD